MSDTATNLQALLHSNFQSEPSSLLLTSQCFSIFRHLSRQSEGVSRLAEKFHFTPNPQPMLSELTAVVKSDEICHVMLEPGTALIRFEPLADEGLSDENLSGTFHQVEWVKTGEKLCGQDQYTETKGKEIILTGRYFTPEPKATPATLGTNPFIKIKHYHAKIRTTVEQIYEKKSNNKIVTQ